MQVTLIDYTGKGHPDEHHAVNLLIFTKQTRLQMSPQQLEYISNMPFYPDKIELLKQMADTIPSSWEFVDFTFMIQDVTRAFTHQFVRSRHASFAQQTMRVLDVSEGPGWTYGTGPSIKYGCEVLQENYDLHMQNTAAAYKTLIENGAAVEDARGVLPTNIHTNIVTKMNMRTFVELVRKRSSRRVQGEYRDVLAAMKAAVLEALPWVEIFIERDADHAAAELREEIDSLCRVAGDYVTEAERIKLHKLVDRIMGG